MNRLARFISVIVLAGWTATAAYAVVPPSASLAAQQTGMSMMGWFLYYSAVIVLCALFAAILALLVWLIRSLFHPNFQKPQ